MAKVISIGNQSFESIREKDNFYIDKTNFIREWWDNDDTVTLITRPRRFGKTLNMSMLECFFSNKYKDRGDLFEGLEIWNDEKYRKLQGTYPVIFLSFARIKQKYIMRRLQKIRYRMNLYELYNEYDYLMKSRIVYNENEKMQNTNHICVGYEMMMWLRICIK